VLTLIRVSRCGIKQWVLPCSNGILRVDKAGRVVLPTAVRDELRLSPGDALELETEGEGITLRPVRPKTTLKKEFGICVYQGEPTDISISTLIDRERDNRTRESF
jgi:AbrB family looped-hinge helix DNA binding protein